jgi:hypothetical protein
MGEECTYESCECNEFDECKPIEERVTNPCFWLGWIKTKNGVHLIRASLIIVVAVMAINLAISGKYIFLGISVLSTTILSYLIVIRSKIKITKDEYDLFDRVNIIVSRKLFGVLSWFSLIFSIFYVVFNFYLIISSFF